MKYSAAWGSLALATLVSGASLRSSGAPRASSRIKGREPALGSKRLSRRLAVVYRHLGCFADMKDDRVMIKQLTTDDMTTELCAQTCSELDATYFGTQFGTECWCAQKEDEDYSRHGVGVCNMWCAGDGSATCGGVDAFDVYALDVPGRPTVPGYLGCYADSKDDRVLQFEKMSDDMKPSTCLDYCTSNGGDVEYYATQFGSECWCGTSDSVLDYDRHGPGVCRTPCSGDKNISCGGHDAFDLFYYRPDGSNDTKAMDPMADMLKRHNAARCVHLADPLTYSDTLAASATLYAEEMAEDTNCGKTDVPDRSGMGSNVHVCASSDATTSCFSVPDAMKDFYDDQVGGGPPNNWGPKGIQMLWEDTTEMGCGSSSCFKEGMVYDILACHYSPPVDPTVDVNEKVGLQYKSFDECGYRE